jgi:hypothetical protein
MTTKNFSAACRLFKSMHTVLSPSIAFATLKCNCSVMVLMYYTFIVSRLYTCSNKIIPNHGSTLPLLRYYNHAFTRWAMRYFNNFSIVLLLLNYLTTNLINQGRGVAPRQNS